MRRFIIFILSSLGLRGPAPARPEEPPNPPAADEARPAEKEKPQGPKKLQLQLPELPAKAASGPEVQDIYADLETFANALTIIQTHYVEETEPKKVIYGSLKGMLTALDPYSQFLDPDAYNEIKVETEGKF